MFTALRSTETGTSAGRFNFGLLTFMAGAGSMLACTALVAGELGGIALGGAVATASSIGLLVGCRRRIRAASAGRTSIRPPLALSENVRSFEYRIAFERLITSISSDFVHVTADQLDCAIDSALERIGKFVGADRSYLFQFSEDECLLSNSHEWCAPGIEPQIDRLQGIPVGCFPWLMEKLGQREDLCIDNVSAMPPEAVAEQTEFMRGGVVSLLVLPLACDDEQRLLGMIGFDAVRSRRTWSAETLALLRIVGEVFTSALARHAVRRHLLTTRSMLAAVLDTSPDPVMALRSVRTASGEIIDFEWELANPGIRRLVNDGGLPLEGARLLELMPAARESGLFDKCARVVETGTSARFEYWNEVANKQRYYDVIAARLADGVTVHFREVTARKRAEISLRESEQRFHDITTAAGEYLWETDASGRYTFVTNPVESILGRRPDELIGRNLFDFMPPEEADRVRDWFCIVAAAGEPFREFECLATRPDGEQRWQQISGEPIRTADGRLVGYRGAGLDITERKIAEQTLRTTTHMLNSILMSATEYAIAAIDQQFRVIHFNPTAERLFGYRADDIVGLTLREIHARANVPAEKLEQAVDCALREGKWEATLTLSNTPHDAKVHAVVMPMRDDDQDCTGFVLFARDVTAARRTEERARIQRDLALALGETEELTDALRLCAGTAMSVADLDAAAVYLRDTDNGAVQLAFYTGLSSELAGQLEFFPAGTPEADLVAAGEPAFFRGDEHHPALVVARQAGRLRALAILPIRHGDAVIGCLAVGTRRHDEIALAARHNVETIAAQMGAAINRLRTSAERQRLVAAVEQVTDAIVITDPQGRVVYVNPAYERISGFSIAEVRGRALDELESGPQESGRRHDLRMALTAGAPWTGRFTSRRRDGSEYQEDVTLSPVRDASGNVVNFVAVKRDVTREVAVESQARQNQKMQAVARLAGGVAHALNNLLTTVIGCSEAIYDHHYADRVTRDYTQRIQTAAGRAADLIGQLLSFSRHRTGQLHILDVNTVVDNAVKLLRPLLNEQVRLDVHLSTEPGAVRADPSQVQELLTTLCMTAQEWMPAGGTLTLETTHVDLAENYAGQPETIAPGRYVTIAVTDTGPGMDAETQARLFEPFFSTNQNGPSANLGLANVYATVRQHNGRIIVHSVPEQGTTIRIFLPRVDAQPIDVDQLEMAGSPRHRDTILLVEDEREVREIVCEILQAEGYTVLPADSAEEAIAICQRDPQRVDLLVTDIVMPGLSGRELAAHLRREFELDRVLFISGYADRALPGDEELDARSDFLAKPFTRKVLTARVRHLLTDDVIAPPRKAVVAPPRS